MKIDHDSKSCHKGLTLDTEKMEVTEITKLAENVSIQNNNQVLEKPVEKPEPEKIIETKTVIEDFKPNYECPNGNCDIGVHKNTNYKKKPKGKCTNCGQFTKHDKGTCPWCKGTEIDELEEDELKDLGIIDPVIDDLEGHNHE